MKYGLTGAILSGAMMLFSLLQMESAWHLYQLDGWDFTFGFLFLCLAFMWFHQLFRHD